MVSLHLLPAVVKSKIASYLSPEDLLSMRQVCRDLATVKPTPPIDATASVVEFRPNNTRGLLDVPLVNVTAVSIDHRLPHVAILRIFQRFPQIRSLEMKCPSGCRALDHQVRFPYGLPNGLESLTLCHPLDMAAFIHIRHIVPRLRLLVFRSMGDEVTLQMAWQYVRAHGPQLVNHNIVTTNTHQPQHRRRDYHRFFA